MDNLKLIEKLQAEYDSLTEARAEAIRRFDRSRDGTEEKQNAKESMNRLSDRIRKIEDRLEVAVELMEMPVEFLCAVCGRNRSNDDVSGEGRACPNCGWVAEGDGESLFMQVAADRPNGPGPDCDPEG